MENDIELRDESNIIKRIEILSTVIEESFDEPDTALKLLNEYNKLYPCQSDEMSMITVAATLITHQNLADTMPKERDYYKIFDDKVKELQDDKISVIWKKNNPKHIPDRWMNIGSNVIPVEFKLHEFNNSALTQLNRYINFYNCEYGIAIGSELTIGLPNNIWFISLSDINNGNIYKILTDIRTTLEKRVSGGQKAYMSKRIDDLEKQIG